MTSCYLHLSAKKRLRNWEYVHIYFTIFDHSVTIIAYLQGGQMCAWQGKNYKR